MDKGNSINVYFDSSTPFDSQNHEIILDKSSHYGIEGQVNHVLLVILIDVTSMWNMAMQNQRNDTSRPLSPNNECLVRLCLSFI